MQNLIERISAQVTYAERLVQLAEEATKLAHAAMKLRQAITGENPTPVSQRTAAQNLREEASDVALCLKVLDIQPDDNTIREKLARWEQTIGGTDMTDKDMIAMLYRDGYRAAAKKLEELTNPWISADTPPEDGTDCLAVTGCGTEGRVYPANYDHGTWWDCMSIRADTATTHWMPIPKVPEVKEH